MLRPAGQQLGKDLTAHPDTGDPAGSAGVVADAVFAGDEDPVQKIKDEFEPKGIKVFPISAATGKGLKELLYAVRNILDSLDPEPIVYEKEYFPEEMYDKSEPIEVYKADEHAFVIEGDRVDRMLGYTNLDDEKGFAFFQKFMKEQGIIEQLESLGIEEGDTVYLGDLEFDYYR